MTPPLWGLVFVAGSAAILWLISLRTRDVSIIDIFWAPGIAGVVDIAALLGQASGPRVSTALFLVNLWAVRLATHIFARRSLPDLGGQERRYATMQRQFGPRWWWWSLIQVFLLQAILMWFIAAPLVAVMLSSRGPMGALDDLGVAIAAGGLLFEALADVQLARFRMNPDNKDKVLDRGLWRWSRHPNYFGEALLWWGFFLLGFAASGAWWLILSPLVVTLLLLQVSGVPVIEDGIEDRRPAYADYKRRVSAFLPWPTR